MGNGHMRKWRHHAHRIRKAATNKLELMVENQDGKCCYCKQDIVCIHAYEDDEIIAMDRWVYLKRERRIVKRASVEHIKPIFHGGNNRPTNLAAACVECNQARSDLGSGRDVDLQKRAMFVYTESVRQFRTNKIMLIKNKVMV